MSDFTHKRRHTLTLKVGADDVGSLARHLEEFAHDLRMGDRMGPNGCSGGWDSNDSYTHVIDEDMTGDRYRNLLSEWHENERADR